MSDLIDRAALIHDLIHNRSFYPVCVRRAIEDAPTIDAAPVVRCRECKHRFFNECVDSHCCQLWGDGFDGVAENAFCSYGERRTDGSTD